MVYKVEVPFCNCSRKEIEHVDGERENRKATKNGDLPTVMSSPMKMEPSTTVKTTDNGLNMGGYDGPFLATAHEFKLYFPAVASAPCTKWYSVILFSMEQV